MTPLLLVLLCAVHGEVASAPAAQPPEGVLTFGSPANYADIVARRDIRDADGRLRREIFYFRRRRMDPVDADNLLAVQIRDYDYDAAGRLTRVETRAPDERLLYTWRRDYVGDSRRPFRSVKTDPDGVRQSETRHSERSWDLTHLTFDDSGQNLIALDGEMPRDVDLASGWGPEVSGLSCGIGATRTVGPADTIEVLVSVRSNDPKPSGGRGRSEFILATASGALVPPSPKADPLDRSGSHLTFWSGTVAHFGDALQLSRRYPALQPGEYVLRAHLHLDGWPVIVSNELRLTIVSGSRP